MNAYGEPTIKFMLTSKQAMMPTRKFSTDAGIDLYTPKSVVVKAFSKSIVDIGVKLKIPEGYGGVIKPKSRHDWLIGGGVLDEGFVGNILVKLVNPYPHKLGADAYTAIAQLLIIPVHLAELEYSIDFFENIKTDRGDTGGIVGNSK